MNRKEIAIVVGAGPGLGNALVRRFVDAEMTVVAVSRKGLGMDDDKYRDSVRGYSCEVTIGEQVKKMFAHVSEQLGPPSLVVFNVGTWDLGGILDISDTLFEQAWRTGCFAGFLVGRAAAESMLGHGHGTIIFSGATGSIRGGAGFAAFAVPKFALRALAQSMARELGPKGVHVAHVILDGMIAQEGDDSAADAVLQPAAIAESYYQLHRQARGAWTHEIDLRPFGEKF
jgi:NAD(P)-dependent dehydrogenase (short-subunit alcohol dehydrogenase family)